MKRIGLALAVSALTTIGLFPAGAAASGPAAPGKKIVALECEGGLEVTASAPGPTGSNGALQLVGQKGHGIVVSSTSLVIDFSTLTVLSEETRTSGGGNAHPNQATVPCTSFFAAKASEYFGSKGLPAGVEPNDVILVGTEAQVILRP
jgi:hypothetical protein